MTNTASSASLGSSVTATEPDVQSQSSRESQVGHFKVVFDPAGVTKEALQWRYAGSGTEDDPYSVDFTPCDPFNPQAWSKTKKWSMTFLTAFSTLAVAFVSSAFSGGLEYIMEEFKISQELSILGISLFVVGFAIGPLLWAPLRSVTESSTILVNKTSDLVCTVNLLVDRFYILPRMRL